MLESYFMMKLAPMNAYPLPEGSRVTPSTLRTGKLMVPRTGFSTEGCVWRYVRDMISNYQWPNPQRLAPEVEKFMRAFCDLASACKMSDARAYYDNGKQTHMLVDRYSGTGLDFHVWHRNESISGGNVRPGFTKFIYKDQALFTFNCPATISKEFFETQVVPKIREIIPPEHWESLGIPQTQA
jgi:hypothetical protein